MGSSREPDEEHLAHGMVKECSSCYGYQGLLRKLKRKRIQELPSLQTSDPQSLPVEASLWHLSLQLKEGPIPFLRLRSLLSLPQESILAAQKSLYKGG